MSPATAETSPCEDADAHANDTGDDPIGALGSSEEYSLALAARIGSKFDLPAPLEAFDFADKGNINLDTYVLSCGSGPRPGEYLLQRINQEVFTRPDFVMTAMIASLEAQRRSVDSGRVPQGREWEVIELVPTRSGEPYLTARDRRGTAWWRLMVKIGDCQTYKSLAEQPEPAKQFALAEEAGRGLAMYGDFTADMDVSSLVSPLPGYRDTRIYYDQLKSVLAGHRSFADAADLLPADPVVRQSTQQHFLVHVSPDEHRRRVDDPGLRHFIELATREEEFGLTLCRKMADASIRTVGIHGDTKLENFLFSASSGQVKSLVDLDTIMPHTWLADYGDMMRSLVNIAGEKEPDLSRVRVDMNIYEAVARGFLGTANEITDAEIALVVSSVEIITLELGIRFLTDYLRGNSYFKLCPADPPALNRTRGMVQLTLFEQLCAHRDEARDLVDRLLQKR